MIGSARPDSRRFVLMRCVDGRIRSVDWLQLPCRGSLYPQIRLEPHVHRARPSRRHRDNEALPRRIRSPCPPCRATLRRVHSPPGPPEVRTQAGRPRVAEPAESFRRRGGHRAGASSAYRPPAATRDDPACPTLKVTAKPAAVMPVGPAAMPPVPEQAGSLGRQLSPASCPVR